MFQGAKVELNQSMETSIRGEVASTLLSTADIRKTLEDETQAIIQRELHLPGGIVATLIDHLRPIALGRQPSAASQREQALRLMVIFASDRSDLNSTLSQLLQSTDSDDTDLRRIAFEAYTPSLDSDTAILDSAIAQASNDLRGGDAGWQSVYVDFFSRFHSGIHVAFFIDHIKDRPDHIVSPAIARSLARMSNDDAIAELVFLAESEHLAIANLAWLGMSDIEPDRNVDPDVRQRSLRKLWHLVASGRGSSELQRDLQGAAVVATEFYKTLSAREHASFVGNVWAEATRQSGIGLWGSWADKVRAMLKYGLSGSTTTPASPLFNLLGLADWSDLVQPWLVEAATGTDAMRAGADILTTEWVARLRFEGMERSGVKESFRNVFSTLIGLEDSFYWVGKARALELAVRFGGDEFMKTLLAAFPELYHGDVHPRWDRDFVGHAAILEAVKIDAGPQGPSEYTARVISWVSERAAPTSALRRQLGEELSKLAERRDAPGDKVELLDYAVTLNSDYAQFKLERGLVYLASGANDLARDDLLKALMDDENLVIDNRVALEFATNGDETSAMAAAEQAARPFQGEERAEHLQIADIYYIRKEDWNSAYAHYQRVRAEGEPEWNMLMGAIAASHIGRNDHEIYLKWLGVRTETGEAELRKYIGSAMDTYLRTKDG